MLAAAAIGYLCKHHATLSAAEGGCQAEIGVASAMAAALIATAYDAESRVVENAAESALEHHLGMTCDPVAGYVQVPCIERCAFGAVKAWTAYAIASNEIASRHRVDFDATVHGAGPDRERHEQQVQGNQRGRTRPLRRALLIEWGSSLEPRWLASQGAPAVAVTSSPCHHSGWLREADFTCRDAAHSSELQLALALTSVMFFTPPAFGQSPADPPGGARSSRHFRTAGSLPHHRQTTIVIEMESSSGKLPKTLRCLSC